MRFPRILSLLAATALLFVSCAQKEYAVKGNTVTVKLQAPVLRQAQEPVGELVEPPVQQASQVRLQVLGEKIIRVSATPDPKFNDRKSLVVLPMKGTTKFQVSMDEGLVKVSTSAVTVTVDTATGKLKFTDAEGKTLLDSGEGGLMAFTPIEVEGKKAYSARVVFDSPRRRGFLRPGPAADGRIRPQGSQRGTVPVQYQDQHPLHRLVQGLRPSVRRLLPEPLGQSQSLAAVGRCVQTV